MRRGTRHLPRGARVTRSPHGEEVPTRPQHADGDERSPRGVLRHLQEGHFNGVADVRLRIVFHDELAETAEASVRQSTEENLATLVAGVDSEIEALLSQDGLSEEAKAAIGEHQATFDAAIADAGDTHVYGDEIRAEAFFDGVRSAFDTLHSSLQEILRETQPTETSDGTSSRPLPERISESGSGSRFDAIISGLQSTFASAFDALTDAFDVARALPILSEPSGNGRAYEKFLAIYDELNASEPMKGTVQAESFDTAA